MPDMNLGHVVGPGVPSGGTAGQFLKKNGSTNYDTSWATPDGSNFNVSTTDARAISQAIPSAEASVAIVINGNTAPAAIASGKYVFIKNHSSLATGLYHTTAAIASGGSVSSSNVAADSNGIANVLNEQMANKVNMSVFTKNNVSINAGEHKNETDSISVSGTVVAVVVLSTQNNAYVFGSASWSNTVVTIGLYNSASSTVTGNLTYGVIYK